MTKKIKVLIIDDSALIRKLLTEILNSDPLIEVIGTAEDPIYAREKIKKLKPDVLTLDIEMPRMDGLTFLKNLMRLHPMPVLMVSTLTEAGANVTLDALDIGAVDFIAKPKLDVANQLLHYAEEIIEKVKTCALATITRKKFSADAVIGKKENLSYRKMDKIIALGASTGGTEAIKEVLMRLPENIPAIIISQHIPLSFSEPFAKRMNNCSLVDVHHAKDGQEIYPGNVYIAPGSHHLLLEKSKDGYICRLNDGPLVNRHKPAVDVMFRSAAQTAGPNALGVILTGMGADGALGLKEMKEAGAKTVVQDENSSVVWGMPGAAVKEGAADFIVPLDKIAAKIVELIQKM